MNIICIDTGTTNIKTVLVDEVGNQIAAVSRPFPYHHGNRSLFSPEKVFSSVCESIRELLRSAPDLNGGVCGLSFTGQRATVIPLNRHYMPCGSGVTWQENRCSEASNRLYEKFAPYEFEQLTGLTRSTIWTVAKLCGGRSGLYDWDANPDYYALLHDYLLFRFGAPGLFTDPSNASLTGLYNTSSGIWSETALRHTEIREEQLPSIQAAGTGAGTVSTGTARQCGLSGEIRLFVGAGDQQCATLGGKGLSSGEDVLCLGTAGILNCPVHRPHTPNKAGFFCTAHAVPDLWVLESIHNTYGTSLDWITGILAAESRNQLLQLAEAAPAGSNGLLFYPYLAGIGSPDFNAAVGGVFSGLTINHSRSDMARAVAEGISFEMRRIMDSVNPYRSSRTVRLSGGSTERPLLTALLADITGQELLQLSTAETTIQGLAVLTWTGAGIYDHIEKASSRVAASVTQTVAPAQPDRYEPLYQRYLAGIDAVKRMPPVGGTIRSEP